MTRLADQIIEYSQTVRGWESEDYRALADALQQAVAFEIDQNLMDAIIAIRRSDARKLIAARSQARAPFRMTWIERAQPDLGQFNRMGALIRVGPSFLEGSIALAQTQDRTRPVINTFQRVFDLRDAPDPIVKSGSSDWVGQMREQYERLASRPVAGGLSVDELMVEETRWDTRPSDFRVAFNRQIVARGYKFRASAPDDLLQLIDNHEEVAVFSSRTAIAALIAMNSRNLVSIDMPENLNKLNKARARSRKAPKLSFSRVTLDVSRAFNRRTEAASGIGGMRAHLVRGHFKLRKSGLFWWSPFVRGDHDCGAVIRAGYDVVRKNVDVANSSELNAGGATA